MKFWLCILGFLLPSSAFAMECKVDDFHLLLLGNNLFVGEEPVPQCQSIMAEKKEVKDENECSNFKQNLGKRCCKLVQTISSRDQRTGYYEIALREGKDGYQANCGKVEWSADGQPKLITQLTEEQQQKHEFEARRKKQEEYAAFIESTKIEREKKWLESRGDIVSLKVDTLLPLDKDVGLKILGMDAHNVPELILKTGCNSNPVWGRECIMLNGSAEIYSNGKIYEIRKGPCKTEQHWHGDYRTTDLEQCEVKISSGPGKAPFLPKTNIVKDIALGGALDGDKVALYTHRGQVLDGEYNFYGTLLSQSPLVYVIAQDYVMHGKSGGRMRPAGVYTPGDGNWEISIITNYGISDISYTPTEFYQNTVKNIILGKLNIQVEPVRPNEVGSPKQGSINKYQLRVTIKSEEIQLLPNDVIILNYDL